MAIYTIADLHLSTSCSKPMDVFVGWENYMERIVSQWNETVGKNDTVIVPGDISWGMTLSESLSDFRLIEELNGNKIILKGNHDYWWTSFSKMQKFFEENGLRTLRILHNNCIVVENKVICGTRGWMIDEGTLLDKKVTLREEGRLKTSLLAAGDSPLEKIVFLHYPPVYKGKESGKMIDIMREFNVKRCFYGHIHGKTHRQATLGEYKGIELELISADYLGFKPKIV